jgi:glycerophosphoryl diester phosphodiesterase
VDVKSTAQQFFDVLDPMIRDYEAHYPGLFTKYAYGDTLTQEGAVMVLLSGNRVSPALLASQSERFITYDGRIPEDINEQWGKEMIPWVSQNWRSLFDSTEVPFKNSTVMEIKSIVDKAHSQGQLVRFWNTPQDPAFWAELVANDVDLLNIDDYDLAYDFIWE